MRLILRRRMLAIAAGLILALLPSTSAWERGGLQAGSSLRTEADLRAPDRFVAVFETTKGTFEIDVHRDWAPRGTDRFFTLIRAGYYDDSRFFRVVADRWAQFGIAGRPAMAQAWRDRTIADDPPRQSNRKGVVAFAFAVAAGRSTQVFINLRDNSDTLDKEPFAPFGRVTRGMDVVDALNSEYGETSGGGIRAGKQAPLFDEGNAYLDRLYPRLDRILRATVRAQ
jgi:cyclophilin family peptidyl-prolyl cis-trans isomerase